MTAMTEKQVTDRGPVPVERPKGGRTVWVLAFVFAILVGFGLGWIVYDNGDTEANLADAQANLADAEARLVEVTAERDALEAQAEPTSARREKVERTFAEMAALLDNPEAVGTEEEVADLLATHATSSALMDDEVFGAVSYRTGFYNTLYANAMDARIDIHHSWVSDDGSQGGALWLWYGTNAAGNPFELAGISLTTHDDAGLITYELVTYPYPDEYVREAVFGEGT